MKNRKVESQVNTVLDIMKDKLGVDIEKDKILKNIYDKDSYRFDIDNLRFNLLVQDKYFFIAISYHPLDMKAVYIDKLIKFSIEVCKQLDVISLFDNSKINKGKGLFGKLTTIYLNKSISQTEKELKEHYLKYFDKITAYKKLIIKNNPFLVFIENSAMKRIQKNKYPHFKTIYPILIIKDLVNNKEYNNVNIRITKLISNDKHDYVIVLGSPPKTFFHYEYYAERKSLSEAIDYIKNKFKERGYELIIDKKKVFNELRIRDI